MKKIFYFYFFLLCTCLCIYVCCVCLLGGQKRMSDPWNWSYRQLIVAWHGCWGPNTGLLEEQCVLLTAESSLQHLFYLIMCVCVFIGCVLLSLGAHWVRRCPIYSRSYRQFQAVRCGHWGQTLGPLLEQYDALSCFVAFPTPCEIRYLFLSLFILKDSVAKMFSSVKIQNRGTGNWLPGWVLVSLPENMVWFPASTSWLTTFCYSRSRDSGFFRDSWAWCLCMQANCHMHK